MYRCPITDSWDERIKMAVYGQTHCKGQDVSILNSENICLVVSETKPKRIPSSFSSLNLYPAVIIK